MAQVRLLLANLGQFLDAPSELPHLSFASLREGGAPVIFQDVVHSSGGPHLPAASKCGMEDNVQFRKSPELAGGPGSPSFG